MSNSLENFFGQLPTPPPHVLQGGAAIGVLTWLIELKETLLAVVEPIRDCSSVWQAFLVYLNLDNSLFLGIATRVTIFIVTTAGLVFLIWLAATRRQGSKTSKSNPPEKDASGQDPKPPA